MKRFLLLAFILLASGSSAFGQCTGIFGPGTVCSTPGTASALPSQTRNPILGAVGVATGSLGLRGTTSGVVTIQPQAAAGTFNFNLPTTAGSAGQPLLSGGGGATGMSFDTLQIAAGGTGATTASDARTALGLGTIALQNANNVNITGGTITGLPNPSAGSDAANKAYVDAAATGIIVHTPVRLATAAVLPNTPTYANGASGVGATLTAGTNTTLTVDGSVAALNDRVLVKDQAAPAQNGVYSVTTAGSGGAAWVLTRVTDFDTTGEMVVGAYFLTTAGAVNINSSFVLQATVPVVGTNAVTFVLFSTSPNAVTSVNIIGGSGLATAGACNSGTSISCTLSVTPAGSTGNVQYNNGGVPGGLTDTQLAARLTPLNNTWTGINIFKGNTYLNGVPMVDVRSGANGCAAAVGDGTTNDKVAIQCQIDYMNATYGGGMVLFCNAAFKVSSTVTWKPGIILQGCGQRSSSITSAGADITILTTAGAGNDFMYLNDLTIIGNTTAGATQVLVTADGVTNMNNCSLTGGFYALQMAGSDGTIFNCFIQGTASAGGNAVSNGSNWYIRVKFDDSGQSHLYGFWQQWDGISSVSENHFEQCDFTGNFTTAAVKISGGSNVHIMVFSGSVFSPAGGAFAIENDQARFVSITGGEIGADISVNAIPTTITGSYGFTGIAASGAVCAANVNVTC